MPSIRSRNATSLLLAALACSPPLRAEPSVADKALADSLFQEGKRLVAAKRYPEACAKLAESQRLDPAPGTRLNLAVCHELEGKTATAWVEFQEALVEARKEGRAERVKLAQTHLAKLEPRLSRLTVVVPEGGRASGLAVTRSGAPLPEAAWGVGAPVDPGEHVVAARAPGHRPWEARVVIVDGESKSVTVPALEREITRPAAAPPPPPVDDTPREDGSGRRHLALGAGGLGAVLVIVGASFGLKTFAKQRESDDHCPGGACDARGVAASDEAHRAAKVSNVAFGLGAVALGAGAALWLTSTSAPSRAAVSPALGPRSAGVSLGGTF